mmetsp:Transcript_1286/g.2154  ORF Transcript_1286/g.2154 Transcript_1286/m.2154 type:complete len:136 (+) Transcript_1286:264-671(+)
MILSNATVQTESGCVTSRKHACYPVLQPFLRPREQDSQLLCLHRTLLGLRPHSQQLLLPPQRQQLPLQQQQLLKEWSLTVLGCVESGMFQEKPQGLVPTVGSERKSRRQAALDGFKPEKSAAWLMSTKKIAQRLT